MLGREVWAVLLTFESSSTSPLKGASPASFMSPMSRADCAWNRRVSSSTSWGFTQRQCQRLRSTTDISYHEH